MSDTGSPKDKSDFADVTIAATLVSTGAEMEKVGQLG